MEIREKIKKWIQQGLEELGYSEFENSFFVGHPKQIDFGDYSTNIAVMTAPLPNLERDLLNYLNNNKLEEIEKVDSKLGFINFYLSQKFFVDSIEEILEKENNFGKNNLLADKKIMVEYTQPNPFKPFHIGHLMSNTIGESISRIIEFSGAKVIRANYQGDVGPHVAKAIYGLLKFGMPEENKSIPEKARYIGELYAKGNDAYEDDPEAKKEINEINKKIYDRSDKKINEIYDWGKRVTLEAFEEIYKMLGTSFNYYFFESTMAPVGQKIVEENIGRVFEKSEGAVVFHAEKYDPKLHTRVFINSQGLPTYEAKELGLTKTKFEKENPDISIVITAHEQGEYMKVVQKAIEEINPSYAERMRHITHGMMRLTSGKMSSRKGNVVTGESLLLDSCAEIFKKIEERDFSSEEKNMISKDVGVAALKYSILKQNIGGDIIYDKEKSISFEGDSGPYLQYSYARANSVLEKAKAGGIRPGLESSKRPGLEEPVFERLLYRFPEIIERSAKEFAPHYIANYLVELARAFNAYYGETKIIDKEDQTSPYKIALTQSFANTIKNGLYLLGIRVPERM